MIEGQSLGEMLGAALRKLPVPIGITQAQAQIWAAESLAQMICIEAPQANFETVWDKLSYLPDNMLVLLETPQGWSALSAIIVNELGIDGGAILPSIQ